MKDFIVNHWDKLSTIILAFLGVVFAGLSAFLSWLAYKRDSAKVIVKMNRSIIMFPINEQSTKLVELDICNTGRRPITIRNFYFEFEGSGKLFFPAKSYEVFVSAPPTFPIKLEESENFNVSLYLDLVIKNVSKTDKKLLRLCFADVSGVIYSSKIKKKYWSEFFKK